ncbi:MAG: hypothetical protein LBG27_08025 [Spirochaetaceae bacterium]|jgi:hypothetical protein|nr:hypothetical protein [Spirochaetaceae bacterium]
MADQRQIAGDAQACGNIEEIQGKLPGMAWRIATAVRTDSSQRSRLAVVPAALSGGVDAEAADTLARILAVQIIWTGAYAAYPRTASLDQILEEHANQMKKGAAEEHLSGIGRGRTRRWCCP